MRVAPPTAVTARCRLFAKEHESARRGCIRMCTSLFGAIISCQSPRDTENQVISVRAGPVSLWREWPTDAASSRNHPGGAAKGCGASGVPSGGEAGQLTDGLLGAVWDHSRDRPVVVPAGCFLKNAPGSDVTRFLAGRTGITRSSTVPRMASFPCQPWRFAVIRGVDHEEGRNHRAVPPRHASRTSRHKPVGNGRFKIHPCRAGIENFAGSKRPKRAAGTRHVRDRHVCSPDLVSHFGGGSLKRG